MIRSFGDKDTEALYDGRPVRRFQAFRRQAERRLQIFDSAASLGDLAALPSNRFEALAGRRKGSYSIRVNRRWRVCFAWRDDEPHGVEIVDTHR